jgi:hypothetical protein
MVTGSFGAGAVSGRARGVVGAAAV